VWCPDADEARHAFLVSAGLRPDGARRELSDGQSNGQSNGHSDGHREDRGDDQGGRTATEVRLAAALPS
jgi:hypothetical protein